MKRVILYLPNANAEESWDADTVSITTSAQRGTEVAMSLARSGKPLVLYPGAFPFTVEEA